MQFDGGKEMLTQFRFSCQDLILANAPRTFRLETSPLLAAAAIIGRWRNSVSILDIGPEGGFEERKSTVRKGTFEKTATGVRIHWADQGSGGEEWIGRIERHHLVFRLAGVTSEYRYIPPRFDPGL